jgi:hypothetical protein
MYKFKSLFLFLTLAIALVAPITMNAQNEYNLTNPVVCPGASSQAITTFTQFDCTGLFYEGNQIEVYFNAETWPQIFEIWTPEFSVNQYNSSMKLTQFTQPSGSTPGTVTFSWTGVDSNGVVHSGTWTGTWISHLVRSNRYWYHPEIETSVLTINQ